MNILMTSSGGVVKDLEGWYEYGLAKELVRKGHDVTVYSSVNVLKIHKGAIKETIDGIKVRRFNPLLPGSLFHMLRNEWDLIHMHHLGYLAPISSYAAIRKKLRYIPTIFNVTGIYHDPFLVKDVNDPFSANIKINNIQKGFPFLKPWKILNWFVHLPLFEARKIVAMTNWEKQELMKFGINENKIDAIPIGVDLDKYKKRISNFFKKMDIDGEILLFVGQPTKRKGWQYFLKAIPEIIKEFPSAKAVFIGYRASQEMEHFIKTLEINDSVVLLGYLSDKEKIEAFQSANAFVFPTLYEGFGMVFLEAMAAGLPIITTNVAGNKEIVENGKNGLLIQSKDEISLVNAVKKILKNKTLARNIRKNNLKKVRKYEWRILVKKYLESYEHALKS